MTIVMVEQNFRFAAPLADRFYVIEHGRVIETFAAAELEARKACCTRCSASEGPARRAGWEFQLERLNMKRNLLSTLVAAASASVPPARTRRSPTASSRSAS
jgi:energy-coupling factor transporter ATP-binding protein EcfA2